MRAYRCDACGRLFLLPNNRLNFEGPEDDDLTDSHVPMNLYMYHDHRLTTCYDICKECADEILTLMNTKRTEYGAGGGC